MTSRSFAVKVELTPEEIEILMTLDDGRSVLGGAWEESMGLKGVICPDCTSESRIDITEVGKQILDELKHEQESSLGMLQMMEVRGYENK